MVQSAHCATLCIVIALAACSSPDAASREEVRALQTSIEQLRADNATLRHELNQVAEGCAPPPEAKPVSRPTVVKLKPITTAAPPLDTRIEMKEPLAGAWAPVATSSSISRRPSAADTMFREGASAVQTGNAKVGAPWLMKFADTYPRDPRADEAIYMAATAQLVGNEIADAQKNFSALVARYPTSEWVPDSMLKIGECQSRLGMRWSAIGTWQSLVAKYPNTRASNAAKSLLATPVTASAAK